MIRAAPEGGVLDAEVLSGLGEEDDGEGGETVLPIRRANSAT